ncbi:hemerythrin domain-containing protein [Hyalangium rubrum]|uniref:Hemerythrin domain-containing protein n=1 Tax=Hyalangium rubrum TaxID=3103134 RepID=A0ABU5H3U6_9BACT|nr:hemerythrin domain-containing protein [Hyalangium sp. s54d21]MDY7227981.1 hemerythrin domain-containing protein [Hyalangium sp. s54d21]
MDALALLKQQHQEVDVLFERIRQCGEEEKILLLGKISEKLTIHAQIEERHFYPFARRMGIQDMVDHSLQEHAQVKQLIAEILQLKRHDPRIEQNVQKLQSSVQEHVKEEENTLFPRVSSVASTEDLMSVGMEMQRTMEELSQQELLKMAENQGSTVAP